MPPMTARSLRITTPQGATFVELFFDLVFVFAVTQVTATLAHDLTSTGVVKTAIVFWLVWWAWTQYTWSLNYADAEHVSVRLLTLAATGLAFIMAITVPLLEGGYGWLFPVSYLVLRVTGLRLQWILARGQVRSPGAIRWTLLSSVGLVAIAVSAIVGPDQRFVWLAVAVVLDFAAAFGGGRGEWTIFAGHFSERHGLFVIIALGESLIAAGLTGSDQPMSPGLLAVTITVVVASGALWWTYFSWAKEALESRMMEQLPIDRGPFARNVYSFGHFPIIAGIIGFAVSIEEGVAHSTDPLPVGGVAALVIGVTLFVGGTHLALWLAGAPRHPIRPAMLGLLLVASPLLLRIPAWSALLAVTALTMTIAVTEHRLVERSDPAAELAG
jgi:low temperature requirement protein LtrA